LTDAEWAEVAQDMAGISGLASGFSIATREWKDWADEGEGISPEVLMVLSWSKERI